MTPDTALLLSKFTLVSGLALWLAVIVVNNTLAFRNGAYSVGMMMAMQLFDQEPRIHSPLLSRRVTSPFWHTLVFAFVLALEVGTVLLLAWGAARLGLAMFAPGEAIPATSAATLGVTALLATSLIMLIGGAWFAYYIRQEGAQITHFALIGLSIGGVVLINLG